jgi:hypothetical protein
MFPSNQSPDIYPSRAEYCCVALFVVGAGKGHVDVMTYTQKRLNQIPPPTIRLFVCLSIISAIGIMGLALVTYSRHEDVERPNVQRLQQPPGGTDHSKSLPGDAC